VPDVGRVMHDDVSAVEEGVAGRAVLGRRDGLVARHAAVCGGHIIVLLLARLGYDKGGFGFLVTTRTHTRTKARAHARTHRHLTG